MAADVLDFDQFWFPMLNLLPIVRNAQTFPFPALPVWVTADWITQLLRLGKKMGEM